MCTLLAVRESQLRAGKLDAYYKKSVGDSACLEQIRLRCWIFSQFDAHSIVLALLSQKQRVLCVPEQLSGLVNLVRGDLSKLSRHSS